MCWGDGRVVKTAESVDLRGSLTVVVVLYHAGTPILSWKLGPAKTSAVSWPMAMAIHRPLVLYIKLIQASFDFSVVHDQDQAQRACSRACVSLRQGYKVGRRMRLGRRWDEWCGVLPMCRLRCEDESSE